MDRINPHKTLLTAREVSRRFGIPIRTVYTWYQLGKITGINVTGKCLRIYGDSLIDQIERKRLSHRK
jgi:predicted site-specific integrase-resolvase